MRPTPPLAFVKFLGLLTSLIVMLSACDPASQTSRDEQITIAINPWPGYEFIYLAEKLGYFKDAGLNAKLVQTSSLSDVQRSYMNGRVDGMASTMIEVVQAAQLSNNPISVVLITDYSNGGDVLIAKKDIKSVSDLKFLTVGAEVGSLGLYIIERALAKHSLTLNDITLKNIAQHEGEKLIAEGQIDAFISYPPYSINALNNENLHVVFDSSEIPYEVVDTISIKKSVLKQDPELAPKLQRAWQLALDYTRDNPREAYALMGERIGISAEEFEGTLSGLKVLNLRDNQTLFSNPESIQEIAQKVCNTLYRADAFEQECDALDNVVHQY